MRLEFKINPEEGMGLDQVYSNWSSNPFLNTGLISKVSRIHGRENM